MSFRARQPGDPCCEEDDCPIIITGWNQVAETWTIAGNNLETASSSALAVTTNEHPDELSTHVIEAEVRGEDDGDVLRLIVAYADSSNYLFVEIEVGTANGVLRLFQVDSGSAFQLGVDVELTYLAPKEWHHVKVCYDGSVLHVWVFDNASFLPGYVYAVSATGTRVGVATGDITTKASFRNVKWWKHYDDGGPYGEPNNCPKCDDIPPIGCQPCEDNESPRFMKVVFTGVAAGNNPDCNCTDFNGTFVVQIRGVTSSLCGLWNNFTLGCGGTSEVNVSFYSNGNAFVFLETGGSASYDRSISFKNVYTANNIPCLDFNNTEFPFSSQGANPSCDGSSAVAYVSTI